MLTQGELTNWWTHYDADTLAAELPDRHLEVRAYEGVGKGAIVCRGPA